MDENRVIVQPRPGKILGIDPAQPRAFDNYFAPDSKRWWRRGMPPLRDSYRQRCYRAETIFEKKIEHRTFNSIQEVAVYVRNLMERPWFQRRWPLFQECLVAYRPGLRCCLGGPMKTVRRGEDIIEVTVGEIIMSSRGIKGSGEVAVLHELAHAVLPIVHQHDRRWARTFIELVSCGMGLPAKMVLAEEFRRQKVPFSPVRQVVASEAQVARLAAARAKVEDK